jgi:hypothetical protein
MDFEQYFKSEKRSRSVHHFRDLQFTDERTGKAICAILNSSLFFFWFISICNGRNLTGVDVGRFPIGEFGAATRRRLVALFDRLMRDYQKNSLIRKRSDCEYQEFRPSMSKVIIDEIDAAAAEHYKFTADELDFIVNFELKYRLGQDESEGDE